MVKLSYWLNPAGLIPRAYRPGRDAARAASSFSWIPPNEPLDMTSRMSPAPASRTMSSNWAPVAGFPTLKILPPLPDPAEGAITFQPGKLAVGEGPLRRTSASRAIRAVADPERGSPGRYRIEREIGEGGMAMAPDP